MKRRRRVDGTRARRGEVATGRTSRVGACDIMCGPRLSRRESGAPSSEVGRVADWWAGRGGSEVFRIGQGTPLRQSNGPRVSHFGGREDAEGRCDSRSASTSGSLSPRSIARTLARCSRSNASHPLPSTGNTRHATCTPDALGRPPPGEGANESWMWLAPKRGWAKAGGERDERGRESEWRGGCEQGADAGKKDERLAARARGRQHRSVSTMSSREEAASDGGQGRTRTSHCRGACLQAQRRRRPCGHPLPTSGALEEERRPQRQRRPRARQRRAAGT